MTSDFRIVFMGTPEFAVESLRAIVEAGFNVVGVVTTPDKPAGRGQKIQESDVKKYAATLGVPILQPEKLKDDEFLAQLRELKADLQVVVAFRMLPEVVWNMPSRGTINLHASLLPQYRGAAPINWAIINGETKTGATTFFIEKEIDTGKVIFRTEVDITPDDSAGSLHDKLMLDGAKLLVKTVEAIRSGSYPQVEQDHAAVIHNAPKIFKDTCRINWGNDIAKIYNFIRGLSPYPAAWTTLANIETQESLSAKIFETQMETSAHSFKPGSLHTDGKTYLKVAVNRGYISIKAIQLEGKKRLAVDEFLRGFKGIEGCEMV